MVKRRKWLGEMAVEPRARPRPKLGARARRDGAHATSGDRSEACSSSEGLPAAVPGASIRGRRTPYGAAPEAPLDRWQTRSKNRVGGALSKGSRSRTARPAAFRSSASAVGSAGICRPLAGRTCGDYMRFSLDHAATDACKYSRRPRRERSAKESAVLLHSRRRRVEHLRKS